MSRNQTTIIKGVAILLMLFLHLFNSGNLTSQCHPLLFVGETPLVTLLTRACNPIPFFIILSGYGLSHAFQQERLSLRRQAVKLLRLYAYYWLVLAVFVPIGTLINPAKYPGTMQNVALNLTAWTPTYNRECWFLFPYAVLCLTSPLLLRLFERIGIAWSLGLTFFVTMSGNYVMSRYIAPNLLYDTPLAHLLNYLGFIFSFAIGAAFHRLSQQHPLRIKAIEGRNLCVALLLALLIGLRCLFATGAFHAFYAAAFILLFLHFDLPKAHCRFFQTMGKHSMGMWMTHTFFCYYLFSPFIYGFRYPLVIYAVLIIVSYACSVVLDFVAKKVHIIR